MPSLSGDSERQWVLMEHSRSVSTASLGSLTGKSTFKLIKFKSNIEFKSEIKFAN